MYADLDRDHPRVGNVSVFFGCGRVQPDQACFDRGRGWLADRALPAIEDEGADWFGRKGSELAAYAKQAARFAQFSPAACRRTTLALSNSPARPPRIGACWPRDGGHCPRQGSGGAYFEAYPDSRGAPSASASERGGGAALKSSRKPATSRCKTPRFRCTYRPRPSTTPADQPSPPPPLPPSTRLPARTSRVRPYPRGRRSLGRPHQRRRR